MSADNSRRPRPVLLLAAFGMIAMSLGAGLFGIGAFLEIAKLSRVAAWPTVEGTITASAAIPGCRGTTGFSPALEYSYVVNDVHFQGKRLDLGMAVCDTQDNAARIAQRYPVGKHVTVHVNPSRPAEAVLEPAVETGALRFMGIAALLVSGTGLYWVLPRARVLLRRRGGKAP